MRDREQEGSEEMTAEELFERTMPEPNTGCWIWIGARNDDGYGHVRSAGAVVGAHRLAWETFVGEIPDGLCILHRCDCPPCVNPAHLYPDTQLENIRDRDSKGRNGHKSKTHCPAGHPYSGENLCIFNGRRHCRECGRKSSRDRYRAIKGLGPDRYRVA